jgi:putative endonuclease
LPILPPAGAWVVYLLECSDHTLYTGITNHLTKRLETHQQGQGARYTRGRRPVKLVYCELQESKSAALKRERAIKALSRPQKETLLANSLTGLRV